MTTKKPRNNNMVSYLSEELCVTALNYGHGLTSFDAAVLNNLGMQMPRKSTQRVEGTRLAIKRVVILDHCAVSTACEVFSAETNPSLLEKITQPGKRMQRD